MEANEAGGEKRLLFSPDPFLLFKELLNRQISLL